MVMKKVNHKVHPTKDHTKWTTDKTVITKAETKCGLGTYMNTEATDEVFKAAMGAQDDDAAFVAPTVSSTTKAMIKAAEAVKEERAAEENPDEQLWDRDGVADLETQWKHEAEELAEATRRSTMVAPSSVSIPHVATGAAAKGTKLIGKADLAVEDGQGEGSASASAKKPPRTRKRATADDGAEGSTAKKAKSSKKVKKA